MKQMDEIEEKIKGAIAANEVSTENIQFEYPADLAHGDLSTNIAMVEAKNAGMAPDELAEKIATVISDIEGVEKAEVAGAGFINIFLAPSVFAGVLKEVLMAPESWGKSNVLSGKHFLIEHSSPNLFKPFHIGHLVNNAVGESLVRLARVCGAKVTTLSFPSDISPGIAKAVWALAGVEKINEQTMGEAYVRGTAAYEKEESARREIDTINTQLYTKEHGETYDVYWRGREFSLEYFKNVITRLGSHFDDLIFESETEEIGKEVVRRNIPNVFEESDGAVIFPGSRYGLFDNVFINSAGFATYLGKDIGLLNIKFKRYTFYTSLTVTDVEQKHHFELVKKAAELIDAEWAKKSRFIHHGRLQFSGGKVSSRYGNVPLVEDLLAQVVSAVIPRVRERNAEADVADVAERIAIAALKYSILKVSTGRNMTFDFARSLSVEGDSGPYVQYAHARACSVLSAAQEEGVAPEVAPPQTLGERRATGMLMQFPYVVRRAQEELEPHYVAVYVGELAALYNSWYATERVLKTPDASRRLALTEAVAITLKNGLWLLGINAPERM